MSDPSLLAIARTLSALRARIMRHTAFVKGCGPSVGDPEFATNKLEIEEIRAGLLTAMRYLHQRERYLDLKQRIAVRMPPDARWRERQSIGDRRAELSAVYALANRVLDELRKLDSDNDKPNVGDILKEQLIEASDIATEATQIIREHGGHLDTLWMQKTTIQNIPLILIIALIAVYCCRSKPDRARG